MKYQNPNIWERDYLQSSPGAGIVKWFGMSQIPMSDNIVSDSFSADINILLQFDDYVFLDQIYYYNLITWLYYSFGVIFHIIHHLEVIFT